MAARLVELRYHPNQDVDMFGNNGAKGRSSLTHPRTNALFLLKSIA
jgi:hypothetical protein